MFLVESEISIFCLMILSFIFGNYFFANKHKQQLNDKLFATVLILSVVQIISEAAVEKMGENLSVKTMSMAEIGIYLFYMFSLIFILQLVVDYFWMQLHKDTPVMVWIIFHIPLFVILIVSFAMPFQGVAVRILQYSSIAYTLMLFFLFIRGYKEMETRMRKGLGWYLAMAFLTFAFNHIFPDAVLNKGLNITMMDLTLFYTLQNPDADLIKELDIQKHRAEAATQAKSAFLSNMSHEIRTPINAVLGMDEMILRESGEEEILHYAEDIRTAGNSLLSLINDILDFSKIEAGKMDIIPVDYEITSVLNDLVNMIKKRAEDKGLELFVKVDPQIPHLLHGDEIRIKQVVTNILTNAVKYTETGSVTLEAEFQKSDEAHIHLCIRVKDTGIGIKKEDIEKLFSAFERIEEERNRSIEGTGLGMNITTQLLNMMSSKLEVESIYGEGSTFFFILEQRVVDWEPIGDLEEALKRSQASHKKYRESFTAPEGKILVVDDTPMNLSVIKGLLKKTLLQIDTAESGMECLQRMEETEYDVVFLDHRMPDMDGIETFGEMQKLPSFLKKPVPVLALTANAVSGAREEYLAAGFTDYLTKPVEPDKLEAALMAYLPAEKVKPGEQAAPVEGSVSGMQAAADADISGGQMEGVERSYETGSPGTDPDLMAVPGWIRSARQIDVEEGLSKCGTPEVYENVVREYLENISDTAEEIERLYQSGDWKNYTIKVHALKSTSAIIGAMELSALAKSLEEAGNAGDVETIHRDTEKLLMWYRDLKEALKPPEEKKETAGLPVIGEDELSDALGAIKEIAMVYDYQGVCDVMHALEAYNMPEEFEERYEQLKNAVKNMDWDTIQGCVTQN